MFNLNGHDMTISNCIVKLDDFYVIDDKNDYDLINRHTKNIVHATNDKDKAVLRV
jgi:hypothetical protein